MNPSNLAFRSFHSIETTLIKVNNGVLLSIDSNDTCLIYSWIALLKGKALSVYVLMDISDTEDYEKVKEVILAKYEITADTYRRRFHSLDINQEETPCELYDHLKDLFYKL